MAKFHSFFTASRHQSIRGTCKFVSFSVVGMDNDPEHVICGILHHIIRQFIGRAWENSVTTAATGTTSKKRKPVDTNRYKTHDEQGRQQCK